MNIQGLLAKHAAGGYDVAFEAHRTSQQVMTGYVVHTDDPAEGFIKNNIAFGACEA